MLASSGMAPAAAKPGPFAWCGAWLDQATTPCLHHCAWMVARGMLQFTINDVGLKRKFPALAPVTRSQCHSRTVCAWCVSVCVCVCVCVPFFPGKKTLAPLMEHVFPNRTSSTQHA